MPIDVKSYSLFTNIVAEFVELPLCDWEVVGSIPSQIIPMILKMVLVALSLGAQHTD